MADSRHVDGSERMYHLGVCYDGLCERYAATGDE